MTALAQLWPAALALVIAAGLWLHGQSVGQAKCEAAYADEIREARNEADHAASVAAIKERERLAAEAERDRLATELEDAAYADPVSAPACLSADRVLRIDRR